MSPASIFAALGMTYLGARGQTAAQMHEVLCLDRDVDHDIGAAAWRPLARSLEVNHRGSTVQLANQLFGARRHAFERPYVERVASAFGAALESLDFADGEAARRHINRWVAARTGDRIANLIGRDVLGAGTDLVLVNAIYFLGQWQAVFARERTEPRPFWLTATGDKPVPMMQRTDTYRIATVERATVLELPYRGDRLAMYVVLPDARDGLAELERALDADQLADWRAACAPDQVAVALPRFTIDPPGALRLDGLLQAAGMRLAFDRERADFTGMVSPERLALSTVLHQAVVQVDEDGTVAAAATAAAMTRGIRWDPPRAFIADHPFLFLIVDRVSDLVLFLGRVVEP